MNLKLEDFIITSDALNITVSAVKKRVGGNNAGQEYLAPLGHFQTVTQALEFIVQQEIRTGTATTVHELLEEVKAIREMVRRAMNNA